MAAGAYVDYAISRIQVWKDLSPEKFQIIGTKPIGSGGFGSIWTARFKSEQVVIKFLENTHPSAFELFKREAKQSYTLHFLGTPRTVRGITHGYLSHPLTRIRTPVLIAQFISGSSLKCLQGTFDNNSLADFLLQMTETLSFVHRNKVYHRDISPYNIMRTPTLDYVLIDYGISKEIQQTGEIAHTLVAHPIFGAPEAPLAVTEKSDICSLGYTCLFLHQIFSLIPLPRDCRITPSPIYPINLLLREMTAANPADRPTAEVIFQRLRSGRYRLT